ENTNNMSLIGYVFDLHSGKVLGLPGRLIMDIAGLFLIFFSVSGIFITFFPSLKRIFKFSPSGFFAAFLKILHKHHIKWCLVIFIPIIIIALTGFFMRPPFVMLLAGKEINAIFHSNPPRNDSWNDSIQSVAVDQDRETILVFAGGKLYEGKWDFSENFKKIPKRLPVHPMGSTFFEYLGGGEYLIGSFSGLFIWDRSNDEFREYFSEEIVKRFSIRKTGPYQINGGIRIGEDFLVLDYHEGMLDVETGKPFLIMPRHFKEKSVFSLWHFLFEIHNGRFARSFIGKWYILHNPVVALGTIIVMFTGLQILIKRKKRLET
ncbi:MAG: PepSY domain-containing protein, partial [Desulfobacteraceae bacterium]|nr:PepSY domain-containing protein [Desulfobacteraceae bacterium]